MNGNEIFYIQIDKSTFFYVVVFTITLQFSNLSDILRRTFAYVDLCRARACNHRSPITNDLETFRFPILANLRSRETSVDIRFGLQVARVE